MDVGKQILIEQYILLVQAGTRTNVGTKDTVCEVGLDQVNP